MAVFDVQLTPETFDLKSNRFEFRISTINKEFADKIVSSIYLSERFNVIAGRTTEKGLIIFRGTIANNLKNYIEDNYPELVERFDIESQVNSQNTVRIFSAQTEFLFDPVLKTSKINEDGSFYRYFFEIILE